MLENKFKIQRKWCSICFLSLDSNYSTSGKIIFFAVVIYFQDCYKHPAKNCFRVCTKLNNMAFAN